MYKIDLESKNSDTTVTLPNGKRLVLKLRYHGGELYTDRLDFWTLAGFTQGGAELWQPVPFIPSVNLLSGFKELTKEYGVFICVNTGVTCDTSEIVGRGYVLHWNDSEL